MGFGGILTMLVGIIGFLNLSQVVTGPFQYVLNAYLTFFGLITFLLEGDMESFKNLPVLGRLGPLAEPYQQVVFKRAQFLTELRGRGLFYLFVGSIAITQCLFCLLFVVGLWNV